METVTTTFVTTKSGTPATITSVMVGPSGSLNDAPAEKRKGLPAGAIAAISIISVLAVAVVGLWLFLARRRRRRSLTGVRGSGASRSTPDGGSTMRSLGAGLGLGPGAIYGLARARTDSAGVPIRTSPLDDEDAYLEAPHSSSAHSGFTGGPNSLEGGLMRETNVGLGSGSVFGVLPAWMSDPARADESGHGAERVRGGNESGEKGPEGLGGKVRERGLLLAAGLGSSASIAAASPQPRSSSSSNKDPFVSPKRTSFAMDPYPQVQRDRSVSPRPVSPTYASILPTRSVASDLGPRPSDEDRRASVRRSNSGPAHLQLSRPPSAWSPVDSPRDKGKEREKENRSATPSPVNEPNMETFGRKRSSVDLSSSSHGHGYGALLVTSSQGHGSATASGENEPGTSSGSGSSGSHQGSAVSHTRRKSRRNSEDEGFFARAASLTRTNLRNRLRRVSASGISSHTEDVQSQRTTRPPSPVSRLVTSTPHVSTPTLNIVVPPSPSSSLPSPRVTSMLVRSQAPGPINLPPVARSAMTRAAGPGSGLPAIMATPSPLPTPDTAPDGLLDPRLTARLREIHAQQASFSTIGLRDDEDYSRPIYALVNNRDSMTSASSEYSQPSQSTTNVHTPTQPEMRV